MLACLLKLYFLVLRSPHDITIGPEPRPGPGAARLVRDAVERKLTRREGDGPERDGDTVSVDSVLYSTARPDSRVDLASQSWT